MTRSLSPGFTSRWPRRGKWKVLWLRKPGAFGVCVVGREGGRRWDGLCWGCLTVAWMRWCKVLLKEMGKLRSPVFMIYIRQFTTQPALNGCVMWILLLVVHITNYPRASCRTHAAIHAAPAHPRRPPSAARHSAPYPTHSTSRPPPTHNHPHHRHATLPYTPTTFPPQSGATVSTALSTTARTRSRNTPDSHSTSSVSSQTRATCLSTRISTPGTGMPIA